MLPRIPPLRRVAYSLARLQLHDSALLDALQAHTRGRLSTAPPQALAGLAVGLAHWDITPDDGWVAELCVEAFAQMAGFSAQVRSVTRDACAALCLATVHA